MFNTISEVAEELRNVEWQLIQRGCRYNDENYTYYAKKGDEEGRVLCKKYKALSHVLDRWNALEELYKA